MRKNIASTPKLNEPSSHCIHPDLDASYPKTTAKTNISHSTTMSDQASKDAAAQQRIVNHMQADHHDSVSPITMVDIRNTTVQLTSFQVIRYLQHHHNLSPWTAGSARMTAISLTAMTFLAGTKTYRIPFNPPLQSYAEARSRVVAMDKTCLAALGRSDITVAEYVRPTGLYAAALAICTAMFLAFSQRWWFAADGVVARVAGQGFAGFAWMIQPWVIWGLVLVHGGELVWFVRERLGRHSVNVRTREFWLWVVSEFVGGVFCSREFDGLVERKRVAKAKQAH
jgi:hypothetical protein